MREANNKVLIEGILSSVSLKDMPYMKDGQQIESIRGTFDVKVPQTKVREDTTDLIVTCSVFAKKYTNKGELNPSYKNMQEFMTSYKSIAATGSEQLADRVRFVGKLSTSLYKAAKDKYQVDVRVSFINKAFGDFKPKARFETEGYLYKMERITDAYGVDLNPKALELTFVVPGWNNTVDVFKINTSSAKIADDVEHYWSVGNTYSLDGIVNFCTKTDIVIDDSGIGEPVQRETTYFSQELIMLHGSDKLNDILSFSKEEIESSLTERAAYIASKKDSMQNIKKAPDVDASDFGF